ncbi:hypothetical protein [Kitasatospora sp. NPDC056181]
MAVARHRHSSAPVVDGLPLLDGPGFWAAHLVDPCEGESVLIWGSQAV